MGLGGRDSAGRQGHGRKPSVYRDVRPNYRLFEIPRVSSRTRRAVVFIGALFFLYVIWNACSPASRPRVSSQPSGTPGPPICFGGGIPRLVVYHQTHFHGSEHVSILPLAGQGESETSATHVIVAAFHVVAANNSINRPEPVIRLNNKEYRAPEFDLIWREVRTLQRKGICVLGMLGGAAQGTYAALDQDDGEAFESVYQYLREMIVRTGLNGLDLDIEEPMELENVVRLIRRLKADFGPSFILTMAPFAQWLWMRRLVDGLRSFDYRDVDRLAGDLIAWYNVQFYCGWGSLESPEDYDAIVGRGFRPDKLVATMLTHPDGCEKGWVEPEIMGRTLRSLRDKHSAFGGVAAWEYFNSSTITPAGRTSWLDMMTKMLGPG